jgi:hypothetical protein
MVTGCPSWIGKYVQSMWGMRICSNKLEKGNNLVVQQIVTKFWCGNHGHRS